MLKYSKIINTLNIKQKKQFYIIIFFQLVKSIFEIISLGSTYPLLYFIFNENFSFLEVYFHFDVNDKASVITFLLLLIIIVFFVKTLVFIIITFIEYKFLAKITKETQIKLFSTYLVQDYSFF